MKKILMTIVLCLSLCLAGCGGKESNEVKPADNKKVEEQTSKTNDKQTDDKESEEKTTVEGAMPNDTKVYPGSDEIVEVKMGTCVNGKQKALCTIKLPTSYSIASLYTDETGEEHTMLEANGIQLSKALEMGAFADDSKIPTTIMMGPYGDIDNDYTIFIDKASAYESDKEYFPDRIEIGKGSDHEAYLYTYEDSIGLCYKINDDWAIQIQNTGELKDEMSLEEIGQEFYNLITPVE